MTVPTLDAEPACPGPVLGLPTLDDTPIPTLRAELRSFDTIPRETWDRLAAQNPWSTPFSAWAFHRAWWDAYGDNAHDETLVVCRDGADAPVAIVPLMHRHEVEPTDAATRTTMRHSDGGGLTAVAPSAKAILFGASYHSDYATILGDPAMLPAIAQAVAGYVSAPVGEAWDVVDLRRLRCQDPTGGQLARALGERGLGELTVEREDVCPVVTFPQGVDIEGFLSTLGKKERHEIRRKVRRAEAVGEVRLTDSTDPGADIELFIDLHQKRWGAKGLFPPTRGGEQSRVLVRRLLELFGPGGPFKLTILTVGDRRIGAGLHFETETDLLYYNAGIDPDARDLSPGVLMVHALVARAIERGIRRMDFLRGDESYKYEWGAVDEPIQRVLLRRGQS